jgi:CheY-like chemotaxis protein
MQRPVRLLVVDDDLVFRRLWCKIAEELGVETAEAGTPEYAQKLLEQWGPDVLVLDLLFPEGSGMSFLEQLRSSERWKRLPVIISSGIAERDVVLRIAHQRVCDYLLKPFTVAEARERLQQVLQRHGLLPSEQSASDDVADHHSTEPPSPPPEDAP